jgi:hypothetical protein
MNNLTVTRYPVALLLGVAMTAGLLFVMQAMIATGVAPALTAHRVFMPRLEVVREDTPAQRRHSRAEYAAL